MQLIVGTITVIVCTLGGYAAMGGKLMVLWQPFEVVIICGAALGAYIIANPKKILKRSVEAVKTSMGGAHYKKDHYLELLCVLFQTLKLIRSKGILAIESHIEKPEESDIFQQFPKFHHNHHAVEFLCDYLRMISLGCENPHTMEDIMNDELDTHHHEELALSGAVQTVADGMPALGIVAAVLGVIKTMGSISEPPEVLGKLIGGALVGTFLGVWLSYGFIAPTATSIGHAINDDSRYYVAIKTALIAHLHGNAPTISVEFARKALPPHLRPTFFEVESAIENLPPVK